MHPINSNYLFVYSSLLRGFRTPEYEYVSRYFDLIGTAKTKGVLSQLESIIVGTPTTEEKYITGELYKIKEPHLFNFAIGQLDEYEGVNPEPPQQPLYSRKLAIVQLPDGSELAAWVYWYKGNVEGFPIIDSGDLFDYIQNQE